MAENTRSTATIENSESKVEKLNGKTNYLGWSKVMMSEFKQRSYWSNKIGFNKTFEEKAAALILKSVSLKIAAMIPDDEGPTVMWDWLKSEYGMDDLYQIKKELKNVKMSGIDLDGFWEKFNMALALYKSAGGKMNYEDQLEIVLDVKVIASVAAQTQAEGDIFNIFELNFIKKCCSIYTNSLSMTHNFISDFFFKSQIGRSFFVIYLTPS